MQISILLCTVSLHTVCAYVPILLHIVPYCACVLVVGLFYSATSPEVLAGYVCTENVLAFVHLYTLAVYTWQRVMHVSFGG